MMLLHSVPCSGPMQHSKCWQCQDADKPHHLLAARLPLRQLEGAVHDQVLGEEVEVKKNGYSGNRASDGWIRHKRSRNAALAVTAPLLAPTVWFHCRVPAHLVVCIWAAI